MFLRNFLHFLTILFFYLTRAEWVFPAGDERRADKGHRYPVKGGRWRGRSSRPGAARRRSAPGRPPSARESVPWRRSRPCWPRASTNNCARRPFTRNIIWRELWLEPDEFIILSQTFFLVVNTNKIVGKNVEISEPILRSFYSFSNQSYGLVFYIVRRIFRTNFPRSWHNTRRRDSDFNLLCRRFNSLNFIALTWKPHNIKKIEVNINQHSVSIQSIKSDCPLKKNQNQAIEQNHWESNEEWLIIDQNITVDQIRLPAENKPKPSHWTKPLRIQWRMDWS